MIIKELAEEFKKQFTCLGENNEKYITFTFPTEVQELIKMEKKLQKNMSLHIPIIDSTRFMASSLSNIVTNFLKEFIELNENSDMNIKNVKRAELNIADYSLEYINFNKKYEQWTPFI